MAYASKPKMYLSVPLAWSALTLLLLFGRASGETAEERTERFSLFGDCKPMILVVEELSDGALKIGLTVHALQAAVESRLRAARLYDSTFSQPESEQEFLALWHALRLARSTLTPFLYVNVHVAGDAFHVSVEYQKWVQDSLSDLSGRATTWEAGSTGTHGDDASYILSSVSRYMDQFLLEFLRVNDEACEKRFSLPNSHNTE